jgi:hypothetical protein
MYAAQISLSLPQVAGTGQTGPGPGSSLATSGKTIPVVQVQWVYDGFYSKEIASVALQVLCYSGSTTLLHIVLFPPTVLRLVQCDAQFELSLRYSC